MNRTIYAKDCLEVLNDQNALPNESVDLIYLDPPFNSKSDYNLPFKGQYKKDAKPVVAFKDTWSWAEEENENLSRLKSGGARPIASGHSRTFKACVQRETEFSNKHIGILAEHGDSAKADEESVEELWQHLFALRSYRESLPKNDYGRNLRSREF